MPFIYAALILILWNEPRQHELHCTFLDWYDLKKKWTTNIQDLRYISAICKALRLNIYNCNCPNMTKNMPR